LHWVGNAIIIKPLTTYQIVHADCTAYLPEIRSTVDLTFLDPPFNQAKEYAYHDDNLPDDAYWDWMESICQKVFDLTSEGGAIYFMQREKNAEQVLRCLRLSGWTFQNLIAWKKKTSAVPGNFRFGKHYQIIAFATKGDRPRVFNRLRPPFA
jgi:DNA modification methylase